MSKLTDGILALSKESADKKKIEFKISITETVNLLLCFMMPQCRLFDFFTPFGISAYTVFFSSDRWFVYFISTILGYLRLGADLKIAAYIGAMILTTAFIGFFRPKAKVRIRALFSGISLFAMLICKNIFTDFYLYDAFLGFVEAILCVAGVYVFERAVPVMVSGADRRYISDVESVCIISVFALLIKSLSGLPLFFGLDIAVVLSIVLLLVLNLEGEISIGAAMGVIIGVMIGSDADSLTSATGAFAFASMCSGLLKRFGKWGVVLGFTFANTVLSAFAGMEFLPFDIFEVIAASVIFSLLPGKVTSYISSFPAKTVHTMADTSVNSAKLQRIICDRLARLSASFASLSATYSKCFENTSMSKQHVIHLLDSASSEICPDCGLKYSCWERNYKTSYKAMFDMLQKAEKKGRLTLSDIPESFSSKCIKNEAFVNSFNRMFEMYKIERIWYDRLNETRMLVAGQLGGVATTIGKISEEFDMCLDVPAEKQLKIALDREGIKVCDVSFMCGRMGEFSTDVSFKNGIYKKKDEEKIISVIESVTDTRVYLSNSEYFDDKLVLTFKPQREYRISTGSASIGRDGEKVSGDSFIICENAYGETVVAISDGMGTGPMASKESVTATELLQKFISSGMDVATSLELINSSLLLRSSGECFATMDVCTVNLSSGVVNFSKSGAAPSYIKNEYGISKVESSSLPFGILGKESEVKNELFPLENYAVILMVSDGVSDVFCADDEDEIIKKLENTETVNPQILASLILSTALELSGGKADDDMTVVAISVWKN